MTITKANFEILKNAVLRSAPSGLELKAIEETENARKQASEKATAYILEKRKTDKNYCR